MFVEAGIAKLATRQAHERLDSSGREVLARAQQRYLACLKVFIFLLQPVRLLCYFLTCIALTDACATGSRSSPSRLLSTSTAAASSSTRSNNSPGGSNSPSKARSTLRRAKECSSPPTSATTTYDGPSPLNLVLLPAFRQADLRFPRFVSKKLDFFAFSKMSEPFPLVARRIVLTSRRPWSPWAFLSKRLRTRPSTGYAPPPSQLNPSCQLTLTPIANPAPQPPLSRRVARRRGSLGEGPRRERSRRDWDLRSGQDPVV